MCGPFNFDTSAFSLLCSPEVYALRESSDLIKTRLRHIYMIHPYSVKMPELLNKHINHTAVILTLFAQQDFTFRKQHGPKGKKTWAWLSTTRRSNIFYQLCQNMIFFLCFAIVNFIIKSSAQNILHKCQKDICNNTVSFSIHTCSLMLSKNYDTTRVIALR